MADARDDLGSTPLHDAARHQAKDVVALLVRSGANTAVADAYGDRAISVILSGSGVDGADGTRAVKAKGGTTIAQSPATAAHAGMPQAARATGCVDVTLPLEEIGPAVVNLVVPPQRDDA